MENNKQRIAEEVIRLRISQMIVNEKHKAGEFKIPLHLGMGHEAIAVAVSEVMEKGDNLLPTHRNIAYNLARAGALRPLMDEYLLKPEGLNRGRSASMNLLNPERGIVYTSSILGNQFPVAVGLAMAQKMFGKSHVTIVMGGDGSIEEGSFYESTLMARSLNVPVLFVIENNDWSMSTRIKDRRSPIDLSLLAKSLDIKYVHLKGNDPYRYLDALKDARNFSVTNNAPVCVEVEVSTLGVFELKTPEHPEGEPIHPHMGSTPALSYRDGPLIEKDAKDPIFVLIGRIGLPAVKEIAERQHVELKKESGLPLDGPESWKW